jgi:hypothetical protein
MLKEILSETLGIKNVEEGEVITPIDEFISKDCFEDEELTKKVKKPVKFEKGDEIEVQIVTPHEIVGYCENKDIYVVLQKYDLTEFENID